MKHFTMFRKFILIALASGTFGGVVGTLATAATQSQASPQAIAAAVQRVQDSSAERTLAAISRKLDTINSTIKTESHYQGLDATSAHRELFQICINQSPTLLSSCLVPVPPSR